jgi:hypothetical protein
MLGKNISYCIQLPDCHRKAGKRRGIIFYLFDFQLILIIKNLLLLFSIFIFLQNRIIPQQVELPFEHFSVDEGMPTTVNYIYQGKQDFCGLLQTAGLINMIKYGLVMARVFINLIKTN